MFVRPRIILVAIAGLAIVGIMVGILRSGDLDRSTLTEKAVNPSSVPAGTDLKVKRFHVAMPVGEEVPDRTGSAISHSERDSASVANNADKQPHRLYQDYLNLAEDGDTDAAYVLVTALEECRNLVRSEDELLTELIYPGKSRGVIDATRRRMSRCSKLFEIVPEAGINENRFYARQLLGCSVAIHCDHESMTKMIRDELSKVQANDIFAWEARLNESLESNDTDGLGI